MQANGNVYKGQSQYMLQAMGLSGSLANGVPNNEAPSQIVRQHHSGLPDVTPPSSASITQASQSLRATANKTAAQKTVQKEQAAIATVTDPTAKAYLEAKLRYFQWMGSFRAPHPQIRRCPIRRLRLRRWQSTTTQKRRSHRHAQPRKSPRRLPPRPRSRHEPTTRRTSQVSIVKTSKL